MADIHNIRELAHLLNLSVTTVSRVLNGKAAEFRISEHTCARVYKAAQEHHYTPNSLARGLKMSRTETIGLIIPDIANPFFADIAKHIEQEARSEGYFIILCDSGEEQEEELKLVQLLKRRKVDGLIIAPVGLQYGHLLELHKASFPLVIIDRYFPGTPLPFITTNNFQGGWDAVSHLVSKGHKRIACIQGIQDSQPNRDRILGFRNALISHNIPIYENLIIGDSFTEENGYIQAKNLLSLNEPPSAIFALSNLISLGVIKAASELGLRIPEDFSLISFDEQPYSAHLGTPMTTIEQQKKEMGRLSVQTLMSLMNKSSNLEPVSVFLESRLIERGSVKQLS